MSNNHRGRDPFDDDDYNDSYREPEKELGARKRHEQNESIDYYNDDVSRKAVGKLFSDKRGGLEPPRAKEPPRPRGFYDDNEAEDDNYDERNDRPRERRPEKIIEPIETEDDIVQGFEKPAPPPRRRPRPEETAREDTDSNYDFALYRKRDRKPSGWAAYDEFDNHSPPEPVKPDPPVRREAKKIENPIRSVPMNPAPIKTVPPQRPKPAIQKKSLKSERDSDFDYDVNDEIPIKQIVIAAVAVVCAILLAVLVFQLVSANGKLKDATEQLEALQDVSTQNGILTMEKEQLQAKVEDLESQIDQLKNPPAPIAPDDDSGDAEASATPADPSQSGTGKTHIVVTGDTLGRIARTYYGSSSGDNVQKIKNANNLSSDNIRLGQELKIPE